MKAAQALAYVRDRKYVIPEDIKLLAVPVLAHRLVLIEGFAGRKAYEDKITTILEEITVPTEDWSN
jgi:MoxR-like ATPase